MVTLKKPNPSKAEITPPSDTLSVGGYDFLSEGDNSNNEMTGGDYDDYMEGYGGKDELYGRAGNDLLSGGNGDDDLFGGDGNDRLYGGAGDDKLWGSAGKDTLWGGAGKDVFHFSNGTSTEAEPSTIKDFKSGEDQISINRRLSGSFDDLDIKQDPIDKSVFIVKDPKSDLSFQVNVTNGTQLTEKDFEFIIDTPY